jgi:hypothetical protein
MGNRTLKAGLFAALAAGALWVLPMSAWAAPVFPEGISADGESLAGKTWEDALHTAEEKVKDQAGTSVALTIEDKKAETTAGELGFHWSNQDDPADPAMSLMIDYDVFYEFIPMDEFGSENPTVVPLWGVEVGKNYAMIITTSCGLWRYLIGDTVQFTSKNPYKFVITGRTKYFINAFGEELIMDNAEKGLAYACEKTGAQVSDYTAAPVYMDSNAKCRHQWLIEFSQEPASLDEFASLLDQKLQEINSDYEAKRFHDVTLQHLEIVKAKPGLFNEWLKSKGKLGGQHKIPRLSNSRKNIDEMLMMNK